MARKFFYACAGLLMLALSYHFGAGRAEAQGVGGAFVAVLATNTQFGGSQIAITSTGEVYASSTGDGRNWVLIDNIVAGGPIPTVRSSWSDVKARYRSKGTDR